MSITDSDIGEAFSTLDSQQLRSCQSEVFKSARNTRADVLLLSKDGQQCVLKDYSNSSKGFAEIFSPFLVYREVKALGRLRGVRGVPELIRKVSSRGFLMEYLPGSRIRDVQNDLDWDQFMFSTESLVDELHQHGVIHGDLRNATNILVDTDHQPIFVDFVSAVHRGHPLNPISKFLYGLCLVIDESAIYKLKSKYAPQLLDKADHQHPLSQNPMERSARWISIRGRNLIQKLFP